MSPEERYIIAMHAFRCALAGDWHGVESAAARLEPEERSQFRDQIAIMGTVVAALL